ncbi:pyridoxal phosphate-dependent aminotransferase [Burkholderia sp. Ac-20353]|uniref:pyridoxal phosphate-dependent aminotransferase n=1 Tax=Burkholderia sp. Ac-20353 TaxID=2703894 RepID=UPI00197BC301|nr:pyridoxal phosphate-dependent aminotransferase [Burkholderia sp. Ac-20353]MBN3786021.1 pyridoxal phosphate-dependent aminotransferase [Burkholderia sp. Ac-20353]
MRFAKRVEQVAPFFVMEFAKRAAALEAKGHHVVKLSVGEPDFGAPPAVISAMVDVVRGGKLPYTAALGLRALRKAISGFYETAHGLNIDPERVVVTAGASAALLLLAAALVEPGDQVIVGDPSYPCNRHFLASFGAEVTLVPTDADTRFQLSAAAVETHWTNRTRGLIVATPSNPTGTSIASSELSAICDFARERGAWRIVDEIYLNLSDDDAAGRPPQTALASDPGAIVINSFSKYFGMTGWRLGWCVVPIDMVPVLERLAQNYYICPSTPAQHAALACFDAGTIAICEERRTELGRRRALVLERLHEIGLSVPVAPDGAFFVYIDVSSTGLGAWEFCERVLDEAHVALTPGKDFGAIGADTYVRLSYATSIDELNEGLARLAHFMSKLTTARASTTLAEENA